MYNIELPWPPSVNHYWRRVGNRMLISRSGRAFRHEVMALVASCQLTTLTGRLDVRINAHPPDRRRRDLDNVLKSLLDAMEHAGVYHDDSQIDRLSIERGPIAPKDGMVDVTLIELEQ